MFKFFSLCSLPSVLSDRNPTTPLLSTKSQPPPSSLINPMRLSTSSNLSLPTVHKKGQVLALASESFAPLAVARKANANTSFSGNIRHRLMVLGSLSLLRDLMSGLALVSLINNEWSLTSMNFSIQSINLIY
jgi:hypothetical protein